MSLFQIVVLICSIFSALAVIGGVVKIAYDTGGIVTRLKQLEKDHGLCRLERIREEASLDKRISLNEVNISYARGRANGGGEQPK